MRRFSSYGPVDPKEHFYVPREALIQDCVNRLVGNPEKQGHYFTIWAPRQTGKTWLMRQVVERLEAQYNDQFILGTLSMQKTSMEDREPPEAFLQRVPLLFRRGFGKDVDQPASWSSWAEFFAVDKGVFDRPVILFLDEFDDLPTSVIDRLVRLFRDMYLDQSNYYLHGLALIGVRAVLGVESDRGSPFNVQRSLQVVNLTEAEVNEMFAQYQKESGQVVEPEVRKTVYEATRGQPGLVSWFGELLTEKYNPDPTMQRSNAMPTQDVDRWNAPRNNAGAVHGNGDIAGRDADSLAGRDADQEIDAPMSRAPVPISMTTWWRVYAAALDVEPNNTVLNLIAKARSSAYQPYISKLFSEPDLPFSFRKDWCNYLYLNGIIDYQIMENQTDWDHSGRTAHTCRFSSPFIQRSLFDAFTEDLVGEKLPVRALDPRDALDDIYTDRGLELPGLLTRYQTYLVQLRAAGVDPWKEQPRRKDLRLTEAVAHFHLYAWLKEAVGRQCIISPEFPTGNGKVDLVIRWQRHMEVIEVKSFTELRDVPKARRQAAHYAKKLGLPRAVLALFVPLSGDNEFLRELSTQEELDGVQVDTTAISWG